MLGNIILWNNAPVPLQTSHNNATSLITQNGGQLWNDGNVYYTDLPNGTLLGTADINTGKSNGLYLPSLTLVYMVNLDADPTDQSVWEYIATGKYLNGVSDVSIYRRIMPAGAYVINNKNRLYLFGGPGSYLMSIDYVYTGIKIKTVPKLSHMLYLF